MNSSGRFARRVTEDLFGHDFGALIAEAIDEVKRQLRRRAESEPGVDKVKFDSYPDWLIPSIDNVAFVDEEA